MAPVSESLEGSAAELPSRNVVTEKISSAIDTRAFELREINKKVRFYYACRQHTLTVLDS